MLSLLDGPRLVTLRGTQKNFMSNRVQWHDDVGLIGNMVDPASSAGPVGCICQLDGMTFGRNSASIPSGYVTHNLRTGGLAMYDVSTGTFHYDFDMRILRPIAGDDDISNEDGASHWTVLPHVLAKARNAKLFLWFGPGWDIIEQELDPVTSHAKGDGWITPGQDAHTVFIGFPDGRIYTYDFRHSVVVQPTKHVRPNTGVFYSKALGVFVSMERDAEAPHEHTLRVWANEVQPATITGPTADKTVEKGRLVTFGVQVLGDQGDACPGIQVVWTMPDDSLFLDRPLDGIPVSTTDADGNAFVRVMVPPGTEAAEIELTAVAKF